MTPEIALFSVAPITTSASGFAYERGRDNIAGAGMWALFGGLSVGAKGYKALSKEIILPTKEGYRVTTKYDELFGKRIVLDYGKSTIKKWTKE